MEQDSAAIWVEYETTKRNKIVIGGIYREHKHLGEDNKTATWLEKKLTQEKRWRRLLRKWREIGKKNKCFVLGNINLGHQKWEVPEAHHEVMIEDTKNLIDTIGFQQVISGTTRQWRLQDDSRLDHIF